MILPKISHPLNDLTIPSTRAPVKLRPMLAKEEKLLLMAKESRDDNDILGAVKQVVNNCLVTKIDIDKLAIFDLEYLFLKIRAFSASNIVEVSYRDNEDYAKISEDYAQSNMPPDKLEKMKEEYSTYTFPIDLNKVEVKFPEGVDRIVKVDETTSIRLRYPSASLYTNKEFLNADGKKMMDILIINCLDAVVQENTPIQFSLASKEEVAEFVDNLPIPAMDKIREFLNELPSVYHELTYTNKQGTERKIVLQTLNDFFTLR